MLKVFEVVWDVFVVEKGGWFFFMKKEISEEFEVVVNILFG